MATIHRFGQALKPITAQSNQEVMRELAVENFAQSDTMVQRVLQILRMCLFRQVSIPSPFGVSI